MVNTLEYCIFTKINAIFWGFLAYSPIEAASDLSIHSFFILWQGRYIEFTIMRDI